jgi:hypothetical protein
MLEYFTSLLSSAAGSTTPSTPQPTDKKSPEIPQTQNEEWELVQAIDDSHLISTLLTDPDPDDYDTTESVTSDVAVLDFIDEEIQVFEPDLVAVRARGKRVRGGGARKAGTAASGGSAMRKNGRQAPRNIFQPKR